MKSAKPGDSTSSVELQNVSPHGMWILVDEREHHLPFEQFPWFREATVAQLSAILSPRPGHLRWPRLDVDLTLDSIVHPEAYPLVSREGG